MLQLNSCYISSRPTLSARGFFFLLFAAKIERPWRAWRPVCARHDRGFAAQFSPQTTGKKPSGTQGIQSHPWYRFQAFAVIVWWMELICTSSKREFVMKFSALNFAHHFPKSWIDRFAHVNGKQQQLKVFSSSPVSPLSQQGTGH